VLALVGRRLSSARATSFGTSVKSASFHHGRSSIVFFSFFFFSFVIAFAIFTLQQWSGQNSVGYYAPQIFTSIGYTGQKNSLLASGVYGVVKVVATAFFVFFFVESFGRKRSLQISAFGMGTLFFIIGALLKSYPPKVVEGQDPPPASKAMAAMLYIYVCFYSMG
jgi:hypothetical protein